MSCAWSRGHVQVVAAKAADRSSARSCTSLTWECNRALSGLLAASMNRPTCLQPVPVSLAATSMVLALGACTPSQGKTFLTHAGQPGVVLNPPQDKAAGSQAWLPKSLPESLEALALSSRHAAQTLRLPEEGLLLGELLHLHLHRHTADLHTLGRDADSQAQLEQALQVRERAGRWCGSKAGSGMWPSLPLQRVL